MVRDTVAVGGQGIVSALIGVNHQITVGSPLILLIRPLALV